MALIVIPSLLSKRPWARIRARCEASSKSSEIPLALAICDQEVNKRILAVPHKVGEEVSDKEMWNHSEPRNVRVCLPRRADESSEVRSSGNNVPPSASFDAEKDEGRTIRLNNCAESP